MPSNEVSEDHFDWKSTASGISRFRLGSSIACHFEEPQPELAASQAAYKSALGGQDRWGFTCKTHEMELWNAWQEDAAGRSYVGVIAAGSLPRPIGMERKTATKQNARASPYGRNQILLSLLVSFRCVSSVVVMFMMAAGLAPAQAPRKPRKNMARLTQKLEERLRAILQESNLPGTTLGFTLPDGTTGSLAAGFADVGKKIPMRPGDRMLSGSIGKTFVAALTLRLVERGKLSLDTHISQWLGKESWFARLPNANDVTLRMLLSHSSGLPNHVEDARFVERAKKHPDAFWSHERLVEYDLDKPPCFPRERGFSTPTPTTSSSQ